MVATEENWRDRVVAIKTLHDQKQKELGEAKAGRPDSVVGKQGWGVRDTAEHFKVNVRYVIEDLSLFNFLEDPRFNDLTRTAALDLLDGKTRKSSEGILYRAIILAISRLNIPAPNMKTLSEAKLILQEGLKTYESRNPGRPKKDIR